MPVIIGARITAERPLTPSTAELHYLACALFETDDAQASHTGQDKPFTIWPLRPAPGPPGLNWQLRCAWLRPDPPVPAVLSLDKLRIGHRNCTVTETMCRTATNAQLTAGPVLSHAEVTFVSPTYFSHNGAALLTPDPRRIADSWRRSWNACLPDPSDLRIGDDTWQEVSKTVELAAYDLRTTVTDSDHGRDQAGFTGTATLRLSRKATPAARSAFSTLTRFAESYVGCGRAEQRPTRCAGAFWAGHAKQRQRDCLNSRAAHRLPVCRTYFVTALVTPMGGLPARKRDR
jgi:hypothetical protein